MPQTINYNVNGNILCDGFNQNELNIAQLVRDCGLMSSTNYNWPTTHCQSWTDPDNIPWAFAAAGYVQIGTKVSFYDNVGSVENELMQNRPVVMKGSTCNACFWDQHIWILDGLLKNYWYDEVSGYDEYGYYYEYCSANSSIFYYSNWGLEGNHNGWYTLYGFIGPEGDSYNSAGMKAFINVRPN